MPKVHNKPIKKTKKGFKQREQKTTEVCPGLAHRTVRCTRKFQSELATFGNSGSHSAKIHRTVRCASGVTATQRQRSSARAVNALQCAQKSEQSQKAHQTVNSDCPVAQLSEAPTVRTQRPGDVAGALDSVRWRTGLSGTPCDRSPHQRSLWWLGL